MTTRHTAPVGIPETLIESVCERLARNLRVRRTLPQGGRLHIDRQLPFLCVYRRPTDSPDAGTERLIRGEASYLVVSGAKQHHEDLTRLLYRVVETLAREFGAFLIVEVWASPDGGKANDPAVPAVSPEFAIHAPPTGIARTIETLEQRLRSVRILKQDVKVDVVRDGRAHPPAMPPLLTAAQARDLRCSQLGIAVPPVYRAPNSEREFPLLARALRRSVSLALRQAYFEFADSHTTHCPAHFHTLGRKAVVKAVWEVDRQLAAVGNRFDYLLQLTPVNTRRAWKQFKGGKFEQAPEFHYRPLPMDPGLLKRKLYRIPIERVEDPALQRLFLEKQEEIELKLTMLRDRDTPRFLYESLQLFGGVTSELLETARHLLERLPRRRARVEGARLDAQAFARRVEAECDYYRELSPSFTASARITGEVNGLLVSRGRLLINEDLRIPPSRVEALLAHEVGTHLLTYYNGRAQPFQQLYSGLVGYEELQEGLAVLSEHLVNGLSASRMRQLAGRVVAVSHLTDGASFVETFRCIHDEYGFAARTAYNITMRVYRGGGLTKDAVYLRGLGQIVRYVRGGGDLGPLWVGKIALEHIPLVVELQYRNVLVPPAVVPRHLSDSSALERLKRLQTNDLSFADLVCRAPANPKVVH